MTSHCSKHSSEEQPTSSYALSGSKEKPGVRNPASDTTLRSISAKPQWSLYLDTSSPSFAAYVRARANRKDDFFIRPAGGVDLCNAAVPVRQKPTA